MPHPPPPSPTLQKRNQYSSQIHQGKKMAMPAPTMLLSDLPAGFRFHPTDQELVAYYLQARAAGQPCPVPIVADLDIYKYSPWDLPSMALFGDREWYFFTPRDRKYPNGLRPNRTATSGFWKATGTDKLISLDHGHGVVDPHPVAVKKALVFYVGRPPTGTKTTWIMHEYRLLMDPNAASSSSSMRLDEWVLCRIFNKISAAPPLPGRDIPPGQEQAYTLPPGVCLEDLLAPPTGNNHTNIVYGYAPPPAGMMYAPPMPENVIQNNNNLDYYDVSGVLLDFQCECHLNNIEGEGEGEGEAISEITGAGEFSKADAMVVNSAASSGDTTAATHPHQSISDSEQQIDSTILMDQQDFK